jgi:hypothetical protein
MARPPLTSPQPKLAHQPFDLAQPDERTDGKLASAAATATLPRRSSCAAAPARTGMRSECLTRTSKQQSTPSSSGRGMDALPGFRGLVDAADVAVPHHRQRRSSRPPPAGPPGHRRRAAKHGPRTPRSGARTGGDRPRAAGRAEPGAGGAAVAATSSMAPSRSGGPALRAETGTVSAIRRSLRSAERVIC